MGDEGVGVGGSGKSDSRHGDSCTGSIVAIWVKRVVEWVAAVKAVALEVQEWNRWRRWRRRREFDALSSTQTITGKEIFNRNERFAGYWI